MNDVKKLIELYEKDYYLWLKSLGEYLEVESVEDETLENQIEEFVNYLSRALKREFKFKFGDYTFELYMGEVFKEKSSQKEAKIKAERLRILVNDVPYAVVYYSKNKNKLDLADYIMSKFNPAIKELRYEFQSTDEILFRQAMYGTMTDVILFIRSNFDSVLEYVRTNFTEKDMELSKLLINFSDRGRLRVKGKLNTKLVKYAIEKGINHIHRELERQLVDAIVLTSLLQMEDEQEMWEELNLSRLYIESFLSYAPSLEDEMDGLFKKAKKEAKEIMRFLFGMNKDITFNLDYVMTADRRSIAGRAKKKRK